MFLFVGCSEVEDEKKTEIQTDDNKNDNDEGKENDDNNDEGKIVIPSNPPSVGVGDGELTRGGDMANRAVTHENLNEFIEVFLAAMNGRSFNSSDARSGRSSLPNEFVRETWRQNARYSYIGDDYGRVEVIREEHGIEEEIKDPQTGIWSDDEIYFISIAYRLFNFSRTGELFFGGGMGVLETSAPENIEGVWHRIIRYSGVISFQGEFSGKIILENVVQERKEQGLEILKDEIISGRFFVESNNEKIDLPIDLWSVYPYSHDTDLGDAEITPTMPEVPNAPNGSLSNRGGESVSAANLYSFFEVFYEELYGNGDRSARGYEYRDSYEVLAHGAHSGHLHQKENSTGRGNNDRFANFSSRTVEYFDYSNGGRLFFGGGIGEANSQHGLRTNEGGNRTRESKQNGTVRFNGEFSGSLVFNNFRYKIEAGNEDNDWTDEFIHIGGTVTVGGIDVSEMYIETILK